MLRVEAPMRRTRWLSGALFLLACSACPTSGQQIGKFVPIPAGSDADHALTEINAATDPTQKLALIDKFAESAGKEGEFPIVTDGLYVDTYIALKNYDKAFEYGDKLFALDPDSFQNAQNMIRAASEKGDLDRLMSYGEKAGGIWRRYKDSAAPAETQPAVWEEQKSEAVEGNGGGRRERQEAGWSGGDRAGDAAKRATVLVGFAETFAD